MELAPEHPAALNDLAWFLALTGREAAALPLARKAAAVSPTSAPILDTYADVLQRLGKCREALPVQQRAVELFPETAGDAERRPYEDRLAKLLGACGQAAP